VEHRDRADRVQPGVQVQQERQEQDDRGVDELERREPYLAVPQPPGDAAQDRRRGDVEPARRERRARIADRDDGGGRSASRCW
jgi:hypothetical protein